MKATMRITNGTFFRRIWSLVVLLGLSTLATTPSFAQFTTIQLNPIGTYATGVFDASAAEIVAHDPATQRLFVINAQAAAVDVIDISDPANPTLAFSIDVTSFGAVANSVSAKNGAIAIAVENVNKQAAGKVVFFDADGNHLSDVTVGALPDMVIFTPNGKRVLVANEGEPSDDYTVDPEGSVSIINVAQGVANVTQADVRTVDFTEFNVGPLDPSIRIFGPGATVAQDLEPEFITVSKNSKTAWVVLQENNAIAIIDIKDAEVEDLVGLGFKNHNASGNGFDASNQDGAINIVTRPTKGMYQPDAIASFRSFSRTYLITANEGDSRDYTGFSEEIRVQDIILDPTAFPNAATLQLPANLGRLKTTTANGDTDGDGDFDEIFSYGARSFSIWDDDGNLVFDSKDELEQITAAALPLNFNSTNDENGSFDARSDDKGPEPEGVVVGKVRSRKYAFIGLERVGGIVVYDVSNPYNPSFVQYINNRDFSGNAALGTAGDLGPEGLLFIPKGKSPNSKPLLVVGNEVSGTTTIYEINIVLAKERDVTTNDQPAELPTKLALQQNYPNPFNPGTTISFSLPKDSNVKIRVVDLNGRTVATLADSRYNAGDHSLPFQANNLASGSYFYTLEINGTVRQMRKLTLLK